MKTLKDISLFIDTIIFFQKDVYVVVLSHYSKDVLLYHIESSFFRLFSRVKNR